MYTRILVPLDGSRLSETVLPSACALASSLGAPIELLHVLTPDSATAHGEAKARARDQGATETELKAGLDKYLRDLSAKFQNTPKIEHSVQTGNAVETIVERAAAQKGTLIAMATRGHSGVKRWLLGSVAEEVLHATENPLLLLKTTEEPPINQRAAFKRILVPLDGSPLAETILPHVAAVAQAMDLEVELLRVFSLPPAAFLAAEPVPYAIEGQALESQKLIETLKEETESFLENTSHYLTAKGINKVSCLALQGSAAEQIIDAATRTADNLIAMSTHGRSGLKRQVLGSITGRVVRYSGDPVLVVRPSTD